jgi:hypothetical protein
MSRNRLLWAALAIHAAATACGDGGGPAPGASTGPAGAHRRADPTAVAAIVDGAEIGLDEVRALMDAADAGLDAERALDALIGERLLAREAARRGVGGVDVGIERRRAMARSLVLAIRDGTTAASLDERTLREDYERQRERFVHGVQRRVIHAVVKTGKRGVGDPAAAAGLARRIREAVAGVADAAEFAARVKPIQKEAGAALKVETLPPFAADSTRFAREFVDAAFAVPEVGGVSPPFASEFGWHVLYVIEERPARDTPFAEARAVLAEERLPKEREARIVQLLMRLSRDNPVFLYDAPAAAGE